MKIIVTAIFLFLSTLMFSQSTLELLQDSCQYLKNYILLDTSQCQCSFDYNADELPFEISYLSKNEKQLFFNNVGAVTEMDSISLYYSLFAMDTLKSELVVIEAQGKSTEPGCQLGFKVSQMYRQFYQISVTGGSKGCARIVTFNVFLKDNKINSVSSDKWKSSTY
jgi:hypothetical protein